MMEQAHVKEPPPVTIEEVSYRGKTLCFPVPLVLQPYYDDTVDAFCVEYEELRIIATGRTWTELLDDIYDEIRIAWRLVALTEDEVLTPRALALKKRLRERITLESRSHDLPV